MDHDSHGRDPADPTVIAACQQTRDARVIDQVASENVVEMRKGNGGVVDRFDGDAASPEEDHGTEDRIAAHTEDKLLRLLADDHRLHGKSFDNGVR